jgi:hypothetical protein
MPDLDVTPPLPIDTVKDGALPLFNVVIVVRVTVTLDITFWEWTRKLSWHGDGTSA